jgi:transcription elongation factor Elf1
MTDRLRAELDADRHEEFGMPTRLRTDTNTRLVTCAACGDGYYVTDALFEHLDAGVGYDPDNAFTCPRCDEEATDIAR